MVPPVVRADNPKEPGVGLRRFAADGNARLEDQVAQRSKLEQDLISQLVENKAVDFEAIGATVARLGPSIATSTQIYPEDWFCGTMRWFIRLYRIPGPFGPIERFEELREVGQEIQG